MMKILRDMIWGLLFSLASSYTIITMTAVFNKNIVFSGAELFEQFMIAAVLGPVIGLGNFIWQIERFSLFVQLVLHYLYVTICVLTAGKIGGWYGELGSSSMWTVLGIEVVIYLFVWMILHIMTQKDIQEVNKAIKKLREGKR